MKYIQTMLVGCAAGLLCSVSALYAAEVVRLSEPVTVTETHEGFGSSMPDQADAMSLGELVSNAESMQGQEVVVKTRVAKVCQKKGCFFIAQEGANSARITFKDYGFFIPSDAGGKEVTLAGTFSRKPVSAEQAAHYAEDLGEEPAVNAPAWEYAIVATSVSIPRS